MTEEKTTKERELEIRERELALKEKELEHRERASQRDYDARCLEATYGYGSRRSSSSQKKDDGFDWGTAAVGAAVGLGLGGLFGDD